MDSKVQNRSTKGDTTLQALPKACSDEKAAVQFMELQRWGDSPACPCCGSVDVYQMKDSKTGERQANYRWRCKDCKKQYTVRTGTVFEESRIELRHWCFAFWRASTSKKGVSALEIHRQTGISYKSSLFMLHRIRFAMAPADSNPLTGIVEVDETYIGGKPRHPAQAREKWTSKVPVMAMIERGGQVRLKIKGDWEDAVGKALKKERPKKVSPDEVTPRRDKV
jgi:transposase-like protein